MEVGGLVAEDTEEAELLSIFFALVFTDVTTPQESVPGAQGIRRSVSLFKYNWVKEPLDKPDIHGYMGHDRMHLQVLRELADTIPRLFTNTLKGLGDQERCLKTERKQVSSQSSSKGKKEDPGNYLAVSLTSIPENCNQ